MSKIMMEDVEKTDKTLSTSTKTEWETASETWQQVQTLKWTITGWQEQPRKINAPFATWPMRSKVDRTAEQELVLVRNLTFPEVGTYNPNKFRRLYNCRRRSESDIPIKRQSEPLYVMKWKPIKVMNNLPSELQPLLQMREGINRAIYKLTQNKLKIHSTPIKDMSTPWRSYDTLSDTCPFCLLVLRNSSSMYMCNCKDLHHVAHARCLAQCKRNSQCKTCGSLYRRFGAKFVQCFDKFFNLLGYVLKAITMISLLCITVPVYQICTK